MELVEIGYPFCRSSKETSCSNKRNEVDTGTGVMAGNVRGELILTGKRNGYAESVRLLCHNHLRLLLYRVLRLAHDTMSYIRGLHMRCIGGGTPSPGLM